MFKLRKKAMTLMELTVVVVLIGILAGIGIASFRKTIANARIREAQSLLLLIKHAEEVYRAESNTFVTCANNGNCNDILRLNLPTPASPTWVYTVPNAGVNTACALATPQIADIPNSYRIRLDTDNPANDESEAVIGGCP